MTQGDEREVQALQCTPRTRTRTRPRAPTRPPVRPATTRTHRKPSHLIPVAVQFVLLREFASRYQICITKKQKQKQKEEKTRAEQSRDRKRQEQRREERRAEKRREEQSRGRWLRRT